MLYKYRVIRLEIEAITQKIDITQPCPFFILPDKGTD